MTRLSAAVSVFLSLQLAYFYVSCAPLKPFLGKGGSHQHCQTYSFSYARESTRASLCRVGHSLILNPRQRFVTHLCVATSWMGGQSAKEGGKESGAPAKEPAARKSHASNYRCTFKCRVRVSAQFVTQIRDSFSCRYLLRQRRPPRATRPTSGTHSRVEFVEY